MRKARCIRLLAILAVSAVWPSFAQGRQSQLDASSWNVQIDQIRHVAAMIPGRRPLRINVLKFAESRRSKKFSVQGAADEPSVQARTVFQIVYADGKVMLDSGMDEQVHRFFGRGTVEPYDPDAAKQVQQALLSARAIIITHEHGDHVAGVIRTPFLAELAPKTLLTRAQVEALETNPQMPEIKITPAMASRYNVVDYDKYLPFRTRYCVDQSARAYSRIANGLRRLGIGQRVPFHRRYRLAYGRRALDQRQRRALDTGR